MSEFSVALTTDTHNQLREHLLRADGQEDLAFVVWKPSMSDRRETAVIQQVVTPEADDRFVHGNVSFASTYFLRACAIASEAGGGIGLIHSHPGGRGWQGLSADDFAAEAGHSAQAKVLTGFPILGLTLAGRDANYSARIWRSHGPREWKPEWARNVRVVGDRMLVSRPSNSKSISARFQRRTIDAWGAETQQTLASLRVGVVGAGSVGSQIVEALARTGFGEVVILDFDVVEDHNLDRILNATARDARRRRGKAELAAASATDHSTNPQFVARWSEHSAVETEGIALLKDCDIIFSCVDRPAGRASLNALAYGHLIPVIDGGVLVDPGRYSMRGAEWRAHVAGPGRRCLECLGQFDPGLVQSDRDGLLDDPSYLAELPKDHVATRNENVYAFSAAAAADQVLTALRMLVAPGGVADIGAQLTHFSNGTTEFDIRNCEPGCPYNAMVGAADAGGLPHGQRHIAAERSRAERSPSNSRTWMPRHIGSVAASVLVAVRNARRGR